ncbi:hypothetical protein [Sphingobacterium faecale]|uniref:DUF1735 domain-containing protein n=1 Tax=Sphingobacterium faecale TaxID=2803775 RepID=A0ABS1R9U1_9SPHI|nr:hypothetical protein [Sphingobacterium faecale]MBL1411438.1 hypothetical protein [Sphingobacterium faecale]
MKTLIHLKQYTFALVLFISAFGCKPDKFVAIDRDPFIAYSMEASDMPVVTINPNVDGSKKIIIFASHPEDSIARFNVRNRSIELDVNSLKFLMVDGRDPVTIDEQGQLSRKVSTVVFEYTVKIPKETKGGQTFTGEFVITSGSGEERVIKVGFNLVSYFRAATLLTVYNGRVKNSMKEYLPTANCFITYQQTSASRPRPDNPSQNETVITGISTAVANPATAITTTNRPKVIAHLFNEIHSLDESRLYLVSPDEPWIADSLRVLNKFTGTYPTAQMNKVRYVDLGPINFLDMDDDDFNKADFEKDGKSKILLKVGNSYAFQTADGRTGVLFYKFVHIYSPEYSIGSPIAYFHIAATTQ